MVDETTCRMVKVVWRSFNALIIIITLWIPIESFQPIPRMIHLSFVEAMIHPLGMAKGFGTSNASTRKTPKDIQKNLKKRYGGSTPDAIAKGTAINMEAARSQWPPHIQTAANLYEEICKWEKYYQRLTIVQHNALDPAQVRRMEQIRASYNDICRTYDLSDAAMHNLFQTLTWDASADAKAARVLLGGTMPSHIRERIQTVRVVFCCVDNRHSHKHHRPANGLPKPSPTRLFVWMWAVGTVPLSPS